MGKKSTGIRFGSIRFVALMRQLRQGPQGRKTKVTKVPTEAIRPDDSVMIMTGTKEKPVLTPRKVTLGLRSDSATEVISGLKPGEKVEVPKVDAKDRRKVNFQDGPGN